MFPQPKLAHLAKAFTIMEMLVSAIILTLIIAIVVQITNSAASVVVGSGKNMDADKQSRMIFNRLAMDLSRMLKRRDVDFSTLKQPGLLQPGNDQFAMYSEADGYFSGSVQPAGSEKAPVSLIAYQIAPENGKPTLRRMAKGLGWEPNAGNWNSIAYLPIKLTDQWPNINQQNNPDPDFKTIADQVFRLEVNYLIKANSTNPARLSITPWDTTALSTSSSIDGLKDVAELVITIAVIDSASRAVVNDYSSLTNAFPDAMEGQDVAESWNRTINEPAFATTAGIPKAAASAVRVFQRYFPLASTP